MSGSSTRSQKNEKTVTLTAMADDSVPRRFGRYEIDHVAGKGAMGWVVLATDRVLRRQVALKLLRITGNAEQQRKQKKQYVDEARAAAQLVHPHILQIYEVGLQDGWVYIAMEVLPGGDLKTMVNVKGALGWLDASRLLIQAADGLAFAHEQGMVHRDVKPANLMLTQRGDCKIVDFGLTLRLDGPVVSPGAGTPNYQSPQAARGFAGPQNDVWGLAASLWYLLTGQPPFGLATPNDVMKIHDTLLLQDLRSLNAGVPEPIVGVIEQALARDPAARFQSVSAFGTSLRSATEKAVADARSGANLQLQELASVASDASRSAASKTSASKTSTKVHVQSDVTPPWVYILIAMLFVGALTSTVLFLMMDDAPTNTGAGDDGTTQGENGNSPLNGQSTGLLPGGMSGPSTDVRGQTTSGGGPSGDPGEGTGPESQVNQDAIDLTALFGQLTTQSGDFAAVASHSDDDHPPSLAVDGDLNTHWQCAWLHWDNNFLVLDMGDVFALSAVTIHWDRPLPDRAGIEVSEDGQRWQAFGQVVHVDAREDTRERLFPMDARYIRIHMYLKDGVTGSIRIREVEAHYE